MSTHREQKHQSPRGPALKEKAVALVTGLTSPAVGTQFTPQSGWGPTTLAQVAPTHQKELAQPVWKQLVL